LLDKTKGDPSARRGSSGEGRPGSRQRGQRRQSTAARKVRSEVECFTVDKHFYGNWRAKFPKICTNGKKSARQKNGVSFGQYFQNESICVGACFAETVRLELVLQETTDFCKQRLRGLRLCPIQYLPGNCQNRRERCSISPSCMNPDGVIWRYLPKQFPPVRRFG
jgi:hypothetical protein